jgi:hypothetical protein
MNRRTVWFIVGGLAVALVLAFGVSRYASSKPDGLEKVAADHRLDTDEKSHTMADGPFADYGTRGIDDPGLSTGVAGVVGVFATFAIAGGLVWLATRRSKRDADPPAAVT